MNSTPPSSSVVLCIGAHPDDVEIGMGGTVASMMQSGCRVHILDLTDGEPTPFGSKEMRKEESLRAANILGVDRTTLDLPNRYLVDDIENRKLVASHIRKHSPDYIFAPYPVDAHPDHIAASKLADAARFYAKLTKSDILGEPCFPRRIIYYFPVHLRLRGVSPSFSIDISNHLEQKRNAILSYHSQFVVNNKQSFVEQIIEENRYWGFQSGVLAAEVFYQHEIVFLNEWPGGYR